MQINSIPPPVDTFEIGTAGLSIIRSSNGEGSHLMSLWFEFFDFTKQLIAKPES
jgi:hypothetical protein